MWSISTELSIKVRSSCQESSLDPLVNIAPQRTITLTLTRPHFLGLVVSNRIVANRHGGEIEFQSEPGDSRFKGVAQ